MKRLIYSLLVLVIVIAALAVIISVSASAGERLPREQGAFNEFEPHSTNEPFLYVKADGTGDCATWEEACDLQTALDQAVSGNEIWVAEGIHRTSHGLPLDEMTDFTFVAWINWEGENNWERVFDFGQDTHRYMKLTPGNFDDNIEFSITASGLDNIQQLIGDPIDTSTWVHVAVTLEDDTGRLFVNGTDVTSGTITLDPRDVYGLDAWLGKSHYDVNAEYNGIMDEVAIFDRALSQSEIQTVIDSGWEGTSGKVLGLHMEEDPARDRSIIYDSSGRGSNGTLITNNGSLNKSVDRENNKAISFDGSEDYLDLPVRRSPGYSFHLRSGVALYGGFAGNETGRDQRDWEQNVTVLSGDMDGDDFTDANGVITDTANITGKNANHVVTAGALITETAILDGFTITGGLANGILYYNSLGGGMKNRLGSPTLTDLTFSGNWANQGGGMYNDSGSPILTRVTFSGNKAELFGGGMYNYNGSPTLNHVTFTGNWAGDKGGGMNNTTEDHLDIWGVVFRDNQAVYGGGLYNRFGGIEMVAGSFSGNSAWDGGGIYNREGSLWMIYSKVGPGNDGITVGGGIDNQGDLFIEESSISGNTGQEGAGISSSGALTMTNCTISSNIATSSGGGLRLTDDSSTLMTHCTVANNKAAENDDFDGRGGGINIEGTEAVVQVKNSIIADNELGEVSPGNGPDISGEFISLGYNLIGNSAGSLGFTHNVNHDQVGSNAEPIDPMLGELALTYPGPTMIHPLRHGSPAIDWIPDQISGCASGAFDQRAVPRPKDGDRDGIAACDIGAYELELDWSQLYLPAAMK